MNVSQFTPNPTNKLTAAMVAAFAGELLKLIIRNAWPQYYDEALFVALDPLLVLAAGYFIKDQANVTTPIVVKPPEDAK